MNGFISKNFQQSNSKFSLICRGILLALALALPLSAWAQTPTYTQSRFAGDEAGDWGGQNGAVIGAPDGTCANMGAVGKVNLIHDFGFDLESVATITGLRFKAKAGAKSGQQIRIRVCDSIEDLGTCSSGFTQGVTIGGTGNCAVTELTNYIEIPAPDLVGLTEGIVESHLFGLSFEKIEKSEVKVDSICLEVDYTTTFGGSVTSTQCFVTPPDQTTLTLQKVVSAGDEPASSWTLTADGPESAQIQGPTGDAAVTNAVVAFGDWDLSESTVSGYSPASGTPLSCLGGTLNGTTLTLAEGDNAVCTFFNAEDPPETATLTLVKEVINGDGGSAGVGDWILSAESTTDFIDGVSGAGSVTNQEVAVGEYTLAENEGPGGYSLSLSCDDGSLEGNVLTLALDDDATCTFTNTYIPPRPPPTAVPTLSQWALILLAMLVLGVGLYSRREHTSRH